MSGEIRVSGVTCFPEWQWGEAVLYYLNGVWGNKLDVMYRPKICFGGVFLCLNQADSSYFAYGVPDNGDGYDAREVGPDPKILSIASGKQTDVEVGLIRFVKDNTIKVLSLGLPAIQGFVILWKKPKRGQYGIACVHVPKDWGSQGFVW